ncbi:MAG: ABC transporter ATP-binding protein, partial [Nostoc sp. DedSLP03]|uniref:ABC transporter ATP-binding protein n=1 Tax=Nostoc sp. DedSLP03 TaxID=3075400 RepID=UPI002AD55371
QGYILPPLVNSFLEITLVASNDLNAATKRLMDLETDFSNSKNYRAEIIDIRGAYKDLSDEERISGNTDNIDYKKRKLRKQIVEVAISICDKYKLEIQDIPKHENTIVVQSKSEKLQTDFYNLQPLDEINRNKTQLEIHKEQFIEIRRQKSISNDSIVFQGEQIYKTYKSRSVKFQLSSVNLTLKIGEITAIVGENGNGKTTLLRIIAGKLAPSAGELHYPGLTPNIKTDMYSIKQQIAYIPQELTAWDGLLFDNLHFAAAVRGFTGQDNKDEVEFITFRLGLEQYKKAKWTEISGGYKMRFTLAKALISKPKLIILDEPLANLDINTQLLFLQDLRDLANSVAEPKSIIISSQNLYEIENVSDNIIFIKDGKTLYNGLFKDFGDDRKENSYEINCNQSKEQIEDLLEKVSYKRIEKAGNGFIIHTHRNINANDLLKVFLEQGISLKYFRDISKSTRKLFENQS